METKDIIVISISVLSFILAFSTFYFNIIRKAIIDVSIGDKVHIYHLRKNTAFYIRFNIINTSKKSGRISKIVLEVVDPEGNARRMPYLGRYLYDNNEYTQVSGRQHFFLESERLLSDQLLWFWWNRERNEMPINSGVYKFTLFVWCNHSRTPLKTDSKNLTITGSSASVLEERYALGTDSRTLIFGFDENHMMGLYAVKGDQSKWHHLVP